MGFRQWQIGRDRGIHHQDIKYETGQAERNQVNDSLPCQVGSVRGNRNDWIMDGSHSAQERECEGSLARDDDG